MIVRKHAPERRRRSVTLAAHGCCCCCCCCLHSLGGVIGAAVGCIGAKSAEARRTVRLYWILLAVSTAVPVAAIASQEQDGLPVALILGALGLPAAQLMASFLTLCAKMFADIDLPTLGRITWKGFLWAVVGALVMIVPFMLFAS